MIIEYYYVIILPYPLIPKQSVIPNHLASVPLLVLRYSLSLAPIKLGSLNYSLLGRLNKQNVNPRTQICHIFFLISMFGKFISFRTISYSQISFFTTYSRTLVEKYLHSLIIPLRFRHVKQDLLIFAHISVQLFSY